MFAIMEIVMFYCVEICKYMDAVQGMSRAVLVPNRRKSSRGATGIATGIGTGHHPVGSSL